MRRFLVLLVSFFGLFSLLLTSNTVFAQEAGKSVESIVAPDYYPIPQPEPGFLGQDHNYTVVFRGNGEAVVSAKIVLTNRGDAALSEVKLRVPKVDPRELSIYQVIRQKVCIRYEPQVYNPATRSYPPQVCAEYQEPDHYQGYYGDAKYQKAKVALDIDTVTITLPQEIPAAKSGSFFVYFRALGYAKKGVFGAYKFTFETLKAEDDIRTLRVGISTDSDLFLKDAKGEVNYRFEDAALQSFSGAGIAAPEKSVALDRYVSQIGQGTITKTASNLAPLESYTVNGAYASSRLKLYGKEIFYALLIFAVVLAFFVLVLRFIFKKLNKLALADVATEEKKAKEGVSALGARMLFVAVGISFVTSLSILIYTVFVYFGGSVLNRLIGYRYDAFFAIILIIISFVVYALLLFVPGIYLGVKKGVGWGIATIVFTVFWLILYLVVAILVLFLLFGSNYPGPIIPFLGDF